MSSPYQWTPFDTGGDSPRSHHVQLPSLTAFSHPDQFNCAAATSPTALSTIMPTPLCMVRRHWCQQTSHPPLLSCSPTLLSVPRPGSALLCAADITLQCTTSYLRASPLRVQRPDRATRFSPGSPGRLFCAQLEGWQEQVVKSMSRLDGIVEPF